MGRMIKHVIRGAAGIAVCTALLTHHAVAAEGAEAEPALEMASGAWSSVGWATLKLAPVRYVLDWVTGPDGQLYAVAPDTYLPEFACDTGQQGGCPLVGIIKWDGRHWRDVPEPPSLRDDKISAIAVFDGGAGPAIHAITFGGQLFQLTPSGWQQLGEELGPDARNRYNRWHLVAAQIASKAVLAAQVDTDVVAVWDGAAWTAWHDEPYGRAVLAMGDKLYVGGRHKQSGFVASFDGERWYALGDSLRCMVTALAKGMDAQAVYAGCDDGRVFRWDGQTWHELPDAPTGYASSMVVLDGKLYVGSVVAGAGDRGFGPLAVWDGNRWASLGLNHRSSVRRLYVHDGSLFVAGALHTVDDRYMGRVFKWTPE